MCPQHTSSFSFHCVPHVTIEIIIASQQETSRFRECHRCYTTDDVIMWIHCQFLISTDIKQTTCCIVRTSCECKSIGKELFWEESKSCEPIGEISESNKLTVTALISLSCPGNVCLHCPSRISHNLAEASHAPETNALQCGDKDNAITSPVWPKNDVHCWPVSMSHKPHDMSPELVTICRWRRRERRELSKHPRKRTVRCVIPDYHPRIDNRISSQCGRAVHVIHAHYLL